MRYPTFRRVMKNGRKKGSGELIRCLYGVAPLNRYGKSIVARLALFAQFFECRQLGRELRKLRQHASPIHVVFRVSKRFLH